MHLVAYYAYQGDTQKAIDHLKLFSKEDNFQFWILLANDDPIFDSLKKNPEFKKLMQDIENRFWDNHKKLRKTLQDQDLL